MDTILKIFQQVLMRHKAVFVRYWVVIILNRSDNNLLIIMLLQVRMPARPSSAVLARLRDELIENEMFPFLNGGTLLGWYRECSVIPHTQDMDISVFAEDYNSGFVEKMERNDSSFMIRRKFGMVTDSE